MPKMITGCFHSVNGSRHYYEEPNVFVDDKRWFQQYHRLDGPAIEYAEGQKWWYWHGVYVPVKSQEEFERWLKLQAFW